MNAIAETATDLRKDLFIEESVNLPMLDKLVNCEAKYVRDLRINLKNTLKSEHLTDKEAALLALSIAANERHQILISTFEKTSQNFGANQKEIAEAIACASLLSANNVLYRFRHFAKDEFYDRSQARIKMTLMARPDLGKEFFELVSLAISAVNGCEQCVKSHEQSLLQLGISKEKIFDAIRLSAVVVSVSKIIE